MFRALHSLAAAARARLALPVLVKELTETASRRRTYVLRVAYAVALYSVFVLTFPEVYRGFGNGTNLPFAMLGMGRRILEQICLLQIFGVLLFQPALMCGRITQEKERDSLVLLFLTELRPWEIILQKYVGGLVPMLSFLLLGLPLAAVAYALGGLDSERLLKMPLSILLLDFQLGALALMCSAWRRTTVDALISTYVLGAAFYCLPPVLTLWLFGYHQIGFILIPLAALHLSGRGWPRTLGSLAPSVLSIVFFLLLARRFLVRRAFAPPGNYLRRLFARLDAFMKRANRIVGGVVLYHDKTALPVEDPVYWRETQRRVLGKLHYLVRVLCGIEILTVLLCILVGTASDSEGSELSPLAAVLGALAVLTLSAAAANSIVSERVGQTLDVLLTTSMSAWEIVRQKERALRRLALIMAVPLLTVFATRAFLLNSSFRSQGAYRSWVPYLACAALTVLVYLPMITWISLWIGIRVRTRFQAILTALGVLTAWAVLFPLVAVLAKPHPVTPLDCLLFLASPLSIPALNETGDLSRLLNFSNPWPLIAANTALYTVVALFMRYRLFTDADRFLRR